MWKKKKIRTGKGKGVQSKFEELLDALLHLYRFVLILKGVFFGFRILIQVGFFGVCLT